MLQSLHIQHFALIDTLDIDFEKGFSVITGETGAGKSILLGAIGLLLGQRADIRSIKKGATRCVIEARFDLHDQPALAAFFEQNELEYDAYECILRRELQSSGKSRAFINDTPVSLAQIRELGEQLMDIHSQHQNLLLHKENYQLNILDLLSGNEKLRNSYQRVYAQYRHLTNEFSRVQGLAEKARVDEDYLHFQLNQIDEAELQEGEDETLRAEADLVSNSVEIKESLYRAFSQMENEEGGLLSNLKEVCNQLESISKFYPDARELAERAESCYLELKDLASEIGSGQEHMEYNPARLEELNQRLNLIYSLQQKHRVNSVNELRSLADDYRKRLQSIATYDETLRNLEKERDTAYIDLLKIGVKLTASRVIGGSKMEKALCNRLVKLGMPHVRFRVEITPYEDPTSTGCDRIRFLFSANKNGNLQDVASVASGGEIARVMLVLKSLIAEVSRMPTLIFDEIDTGVSGETATRMAEIMQEMGQYMQVFSITHLPQIAARGNVHYFVYKEDGEESTSSHIRRLTPEERVTELAHMLSGAVVTDAALNNAKELLKEYGTK